MFIYINDIIIYNNIIMYNLDNIPPELVIKIFGYVPIADLIGALLSNKFIYINYYPIYAKKIEDDHIKICIESLNRYIPLISIKHNNDEIEPENIKDMEEYYPNIKVYIYPYVSHYYELISNEGINHHKNIPIEIDGMGNIINKTEIRSMLMDEAKKFERVLDKTIFNVPFVTVYFHKILNLFERFGESCKFTFYNENGNNIKMRDLIKFLWISGNNINTCKVIYNGKNKNNIPTITLSQ